MPAMLALRRLALTALVAVAAAAVLPGAQPPGGAPAPAVPKALASVPANGFLVLSVDLARLWDDPALAPMREWFAGQKEVTLERFVGVGPADLERVTLYFPDAYGLWVGPVAVVTTRQPYNEARVVKTLLAQGKQDDRKRLERRGDVLRLQGGSPFELVVFGDARTLVFLPDFDARPDEFGSRSRLTANLLTRPSDGPLSPALAAAGTSPVSVGLDVRQVGQMLGLGRFGLVPYEHAMRATHATLTADLAAGGLRTRLVLTYPTAEDARRAGPVLEEGIADLAGVAAAEARRVPARHEQTVLSPDLSAAATDLLKAAKVEVRGSTVVAVADRPGRDAAGKLGTAILSRFAVAHRRVEAEGNLRQILLGLHNIHDVMGGFPGDVVGVDGDIPCSWRVQLLPFIEHNNLFQHLDRQLPWNHPRNKAVLEKAEMPRVFEVPGRPAPKGHTYWRSFSRPKGAQPADATPWLVEGGRGPRFTDLKDGKENTIAVVEAGEAVLWYAPDVLAYDPRRPLPPLGEKDGPGFLAGMGDATVRFIDAGTDESHVRAAITRNGGEMLRFPRR